MQKFNFRGVIYQAPILWLLGWESWLEGLSVSKLIKPFFHVFLWY